MKVIPRARIKIRKMLPALIIGISVLLSLGAVAPLSRAQVPTYGCAVEFTKDGVLIPGSTHRQFDPWADDMKVIFTGKGEVQFTMDGNPVGRKNKAPGKANDFNVKWDPNTGVISSFEWTDDCSPLKKPVPVPSGANDLDFKTNGVITNLWFTQEGTKVQEIGVPAGANDLHFVANEPRPA